MTTCKAFNDNLLSVNPELASEWHPTKNGNLKPTDVTAGSGKKVWWLGKCGHEWDAIISNRVKGRGCPICSGYRVIQGINDLATLDPKLASEWHPTKNGSLKPTNVGEGYSKKVWWLGKCGHEWSASVGNRNRQNSGCPYCSNPPKMILAGFNDLATLNPKLASEWHPTKNGDLKPDAVGKGYGKKVWWLGKCGHEWDAIISNRIKGAGCPMCHGLKPIIGKTDLQTTRPDLASEWHPTKNDNLKPTDVTAGSGQKIWWLGKCGHEWDATVSSRTRDKGTGCPYCSNIKILTGFNDLATLVPELVSEWHPTKNGSLKPTSVGEGYSKKVWWLGKCGHEWDAKVVSRVRQNSGCPYCSNPPKMILAGFNDLATLNPELASEWHPTKNGDLKPTGVGIGSHTTVWWLGKCGHEWDAEIANRVRGNGCPYCSGRKVLVGFNDLVSTNPELASEWHPTRNGNLKSTDVSAGRAQMIWWVCKQGHEWQATLNDRSSGNGCPYCSGQRILVGFNDLTTTDPELASEWHPTKNGDLKPNAVGKGYRKKVWWLGKCGHEWYSAVADRYQNRKKHQGSGCPYCSGQKILVGFNDLNTTNPDLASEWHPTKNGDLKPCDVMSNSSTKVWWQCAYGHEWKASPNGRNKGFGRGCPICNESRLEKTTRKILLKLNINFKEQVKFEDLKHINLLSYDFGIYNNEIICALIECQGEQHYRPVDLFGGAKQFQIQKKHDEIKKEYCSKNGIPLIEIPYNYTDDEIELVIQETISKYL